MKNFAWCAAIEISPFFTALLPSFCFLEKLRELFFSALHQSRGKKNVDLAYYSCSLELTPEISPHLTTVIAHDRAPSMTMTNPGREFLRKLRFANGRERNSESPPPGWMKIDFSHACARSFAMNLTALTARENDVCGVWCTEKGTCSHAEVLLIFELRHTEKMH